MRIRRLVPSCAVLALCLTGCGGVDGGVRAEGPAATKIPWVGPMYMMDWYGRSWQRPKEVDATTSVSLGGLKWRDWGSPKARAIGVATDVDCLSGCPDDDSRPNSYQVEVVLSGPVRRGGVSFYSHVNLVPVHPPAPFWAKGNDSTDLEVPDDA